MIEKQTTAIPFGGGLDTKTAPVHVSPQKVTSLQNGVFTTRGAIRKRNGYAAATSAALTTGSFVAQYNSELVASDGVTLDSWNFTTSAWMNKGHCQSAGVTRSPIQISQPLLSCGNTAINGTLQCTVYTTSDSVVRYTISDVASGALVVNAAQVSGQTSNITPVVLSLGSNFIVVLATPAAGLFYVPIPIANPTVPGAGVQVGTDTANLIVDAVVATGGTLAWIVWTSTTGGNNLRYATLTSGLTLTANAGFALLAQASGLGVGPNTTNTDVVIGYGTIGSVVYYADVTTAFAIANQAIVDTLAANTFLTSATTSCASFLGNVVGTIYYTATNTTTKYAFIKSCPVTGNVPGTPVVFARSVVLASKLFSQGSSSYIFTYYQRDPVASIAGTAYLGGSAYFLLNTSGNIIARIAQEDAAWMNGVPALLPANPATGRWMLPTLVTTRVTNTSSIINYTQLIGAVNTTVDLSGAAGYQSAILGDVLHIMTGYLMMYDGAAVVEHGFHYAPARVSAVTQALGAPLSVGVYGYYVVYEWTDARGNLHRSAPTSTTLTTSAGNQGAQLTIATLRLTAKSNVRIAVYRTAANASVPYFVATVANDPTVDTVTYTETAAFTDTNIQGAIQLYTQSAVFNSAAPPGTSLIIFKNRLCFITSEDARQTWYSKQVIPGQPVEFNDTFYISQDQLDGNPTALGVMDDKLITFKRDSAYYMTGSGPDPLGGNNDFSTPLLVNASSGCSNPRSIQMTPDGLMYQSPKGIYMLSRGLQEVYVGAEVENSATWSSNPVTGVMLVPNTTEVRFALGSTMVVWDYFFKQWSTFTNMAATYTALYGNLATFATAAGQIYQETPGTFTDAGSAITLKLITGWFSLAGLQGWQRLSRIYVLGDFKSTSTLSVGMAVDYDPAIVQTMTGSANNPLEWRFNVTRQKSQAFQLTIQDTGTTGESFDLAGLSFLWAPKKGLGKLPATRVA